MSQPKRQKTGGSEDCKIGPTVDPLTSDRHCTKCNAICKNLALDKYAGIKCGSCGHQFELPDQSDGNFRRCIRCWAFIRCTEKFCLMCGRENLFYDPNKPSRVQKALEKTIEMKLRKSIKLELELAAKQDEFERLSQSCVNDGNFSDSDAVNTQEPLATSTPNDSMSQKEETSSKTDDES